MEIANERWFQASLPIKYGGFEMTSVKEISQFAFTSSWSHALSILPIRFPIMEKSIDDVILQKGSMGSLGYEIHKAVQYLQARILFI